MSSSAEDAGEPVHDGQKCVISPNMMKFATLTTLLVSDFDIVFTIFACISFMQSGGLFTMFTIVLVFFFFVYVAFCIVAARESYKFVERFMSKVRLNEINGISLEDIEDALEGKRVFWMGPVYETAKKRKGALEALIAAAPEQADAGEISMPLLEQSIKIAEKVGVAELLMPDDLGAGARALFTAHQKLKLARKVQAAGADASLVALLGLPDVEPPPPPEPDFRAKKIYEEEKAVADAAGDDNLSKMLELAYLKHIDSFRVDAKLKDKASGKARDADESSLMPTLPAHVPRDCTFYLSHRGTTLCVLQVLDTGRALYLLCEAKGILAGYYQATRSFSRRIVKPTHSIPYVRLMYFGWQPSVSHMDFAGILNANAIYSFTVGLPQLIFSIAFLIADRETGRVTSPCETNEALMCTVLEDLKKPLVQFNIIACSVFVGITSLIISVSNIIIDFPAQIFAIAEQEEEQLRLGLEAEAMTKEWEQKLAAELEENVKKMLKMSTAFEANKLQGIEAPRLVIDDVIKLERQAMKKKVAYIEFFMDRAQRQQKQGLAARKKAQKKKEEGSG